jgi:predicted RNA-binding Zn ribbon-like protein
MPKASGSYYFIGNLLCLDFVNTEAIARGEPVDLVDGFTGLVDWLRAAGQLSPADARSVEQRWSATSAATLAEAKSLRRALRGMAERLSEGKPATQASLDAINGVLASRPAYPQIVRKGNGYAATMQAATESARHLLVPIAESAAWLLEHGDMSLLHRCENPSCVLYFYDTTKNKRRRWCSMEACGSRAKAAAYYRRLKSETTSGQTT